jgi:endonuclease/exonuclease/phosphatase family metal-dependent hydrolase
MTVGHRRTGTRHSRKSVRSFLWMVGCIPTRATWCRYPEEVPVRFFVAITAIAVSSLAASPRSTSRAAESCAARSPDSGVAVVTWHDGPTEDADALNRWCRGVGQPIVVTEAAPTDGDVVPLDELVVVSWNAHLAEGRLAELIDRLRSGSLTDGRPVRHFVLLLQELFRRGDDVPVFGGTLRSAHAIKARDPRAPDAWDYARTLGLSFFYVPSMRNGADLREDRGNAIITTEPIVDPVALELPLERQRRVAIGVAIAARSSSRIGRLHLVDVHLEPLSSPASLWIFRNPRRRDYLFFESTGGWTATTIRLDEHFGSDHYPVLARFAPPH